MCRANLSQLLLITSVSFLFVTTSQVITVGFFVCAVFSFRVVCYLLIEIVTGVLAVHADDKS